MLSAIKLLHHTTDKFAGY